MDASHPAPKAVQCDVEIVGDAATLTVGEQDAILDFDVAAASPPPAGMVEARFRLKTSVGGELGEYLLYWAVDQESAWRRFRRIPFIADGSWHEYRIPLSATGALKALRFTFGRQPHELQLADVRIASIVDETPPELVAQQAEMPATINVASSVLALSLDCVTHRYVIRDRRTDRTWHSTPVSPWLRLCRAELVDERTLALTMFDNSARRIVEARASVNDDGDAIFEVTPGDPQQTLWAAANYPPRFSTDFAEGRIVFCDRSCGVLLEQRDDAYASWPLRVYGNTHCLDMPWMGLFDAERGDGVMLLVETPMDAEVALIADDQGRHWPEVRWLPSLDSFRYPRRASYRFTVDGGYVALASRYRQHLQAEGRFKTLAEKAAAKPAVERLRGAPSLWGGRFPEKFVRQMRPLGLRTGIIGTCKEPGILAWLNDLGYLTGSYDNYTDILEGDASKFLSDNVAAASVRSRPGGPPKYGWKKRSGEQMYWRSSSAWLPVFEKSVAAELRRLPFSSRFIDVAAATDLLEDFHPAHPFDRRQDRENRRALFRRMNECGLVLGTEHGNDWVVDLVEYFEGGMSGPFWWSSWAAGHLERPRRDQLSEKYLKFGMGYSNRIPLWELVYHDCAVNTWYWGDTAGMLFEAAPELADRKDLFNLLYGTTPLLWMDGTGYRLPEQRHRMLRTYHDTCPWHAEVAFEQLLAHEFLSPDRAVQRTSFANGGVAIVNFADEPRDIDVSGVVATLAPRGYLARCGDFEQSKLWADGAPETVIRKPGYLVVEATGTSFVSGIRCDGRATAFQSGPDRWNVFVDPNSELQVNVAEVTGWDRDDRVRLCHMDDIGEIRAPIAEADQNGTLHVKATANAWRFVIVRGRPAPQSALTNASKEIEMTGDN